MQYADQPLLQVALAAVEVQQLAPPAGSQVDGQGVDGEVAPVQIQLD
jgi:hypothetical protein